MKNIKTFALIFLLTIGFTFQNCNKCPPFEGGYFDIRGFEIVNYTTSSGDVIEENQEVEFSFYGSLALAFEVDYLVNHIEEKFPMNFSLMNTAYAEDCSSNGVNGSKQESIQSLTVVTLNDFNNEYMANDTINKILNVRGTQFNLDEYLANDSSLVQSELFELNLSNPPTLNEEFKVKMILELSTNETYQAESIPFILK